MKDEFAEIYAIFSSNNNHDNLNKTILITLRTLSLIEVILSISKTNNKSLVRHI